LNSELFSNYKHHTTLKGLIGISPGVQSPSSVSFIPEVFQIEKLL